MSFNLSFLLPFGLLFIHVGFAASDSDTAIIYNGFKSADLVLDGIATITPDGILRLTNKTKAATGHAFYPDPILFKQPQSGSVFSFSTYFVFSIIPQYSDVIGYGLVFIITPTCGLPYSSSNDYLGLFNVTNNGNTTNHVVGVEFDTNLSPEFGDIDNKHVGIDINSLESAVSASARYFINNTSSANISLVNDTIQVWIEYDASMNQMDVSIAPINAVKPPIPLLSLSGDLSPILNDSMYIGFSSSTGSAVSNSHYIHSWSFSLIRTSLLPLNEKSSLTKKMVIILSTTIAPILLATILYGVFYFVRRTKNSEEIEDWESEYGPHRFKYKELHVATKGFQDKAILGAGGFGRVYKGVLPKSNFSVAIKKVSHESKQGIKEFVAEIISMGRIRHRNLVQLLGYCRRNGELLLVYDYMPNGSLDKILHRNPSPSLALNWSQRFKIMKGVASGLLYLHEGWEQIIVHRDIKASNILLDSELNGRLSDFGLARLHDHGADPHTTHVMGTLGYIAPEYSRTGKATRSSDVFSFGAFLLEVACGRRPIDPLAPEEERVLVDKVFGCWKDGHILRAVDVNLSGVFIEEEVEMVLKLGLLCSNVEAEERPTMREVVAYLDEVVAMADLEGLELGTGGVYFVGEGRERFTDFPVMHYSSTITESQLSQGR